PQPRASSLAGARRYRRYRTRITEGARMLSANAARAYADIGLETGVGGASPQRLVVMLYDGAIDAIGDARTHVASGAHGPRSAAISRAVGIIEQGLRASL